MTQKYHIAALPLLIFVFCACGFGQTRAPSNSARTTASRRAKPSPAVPAIPVAAPASLLSRPAQLAKVTLVSGQLTVQADNSSLSEILSRISKTGGMKIDGLENVGDSGQRIFGTYGPGSPRDVLSELLNGCGYNVMMLGKTVSGTPRELALMPKAAGGVPNPPSHPARDQNDVQNQQDNNGADQPTQYPEEQSPPDQPPPTPSGMNNGIRTPQEILQQLEQQQRQQEQQQQQQEQQPQN